jgi:5-formyltetrahydrofolate cyclo-ligase
MPPDEKSSLRRLAEARRAAVARDGTGETLARNFLTGVPWREHQVISGYLPIGSEADVLPLLRALAAQGARLALPVVPGKAAPLLFRAWRPGEGLEQGVYGTSHPPPAAPELEPDLLLVPLLAFDASGARLGYGGGYYDRTLAALRRRRGTVAVGIGFEAQLFPGLPVGAHDERLDFMVTEQRVREFTR